MTRVFVLGAGFSKAINNQMPVLTELSAEVERRLTGSGRDKIPGTGTAVVKNFEAWLDYLAGSPPWLLAPDQLRNRAGFIEVAKAMYDVLTDAQGVTTGEPCPPWLTQLVQYWQGQAACVLTLNYDVLVESAWLSRYRVDGKSHLDLYPVSITPVESRTGFGPGHTPEPEGQGMRLIKLHGSLTWWYSGDESPPSDPIFDHGVRGHWEISLYPPFYSDYTVDKSPMIVPPTAIKTGYYRNQIIRTLWVQGAKALRDADEIVMMGLSLPPSDMVFRSMLATVVKPGAVIVPVNRRDDVAHELETLFEDTSSRVSVDRSAIGGDDPIQRWVAANVN